ncbi:GPP34 family phosphoprotein [Herbidospora sp. NEAU-GS84]|uniref:GPP34 family phosphoprotein n=1 Tax=Herbidospora solisilvae TaxID=2696284 RepID=A0A7C9NZQ4_9ACTN|nr:GPP34 family phosphoprotein [Herbidospora solisilvae]NAS22057.1 GPP34 family phosphoprotein [Herbidospora solisilvae]
MTSIIAEDVLLLGYDEEKGRPTIGSTELNAGLAGALLAELAIRDRLTLTDKKVVVTDPTPVGEPELDAALARIAAEAKVRKPEWWVDKLEGAKVRERLLVRLVEGGVLSEERGKILGLFKTVKYPELDGSVERAVRMRVESVLNGAEPDERTAVLIGIMHAAKALKKQFPGADEARVKEITEGDWAGEGVKQAIAAVEAAVLMVITTAVVVTVVS